MTPSGPRSLGGRSKPRGICPACARNVPVIGANFVGWHKKRGVGRCPGVDGQALPLPKDGA